MRLQSTPEQHQGARAEDLPETRTDEKNMNSKSKKRRLTELEKIHEDIRSIKELRDLMNVNTVRACRKKKSKITLQEEPTYNIAETFSLSTLDETMKIAMEFLIEFESELN